jgi:integrase
MAEGIDPVVAAADSKVMSVTLDEVRNRYLAVRNLSKSGRKVYTSLLNRCLGDWLKKPLKSITKDMVELRHQELTRPTKFGTDGKCQANMAMTAFNTLFNLAMDEYETGDGEPVISRNPVRRLTQNNRWHVIPRRQVIVPDERLAAWYAAVQGIRQPTVRDYVLFVLLTGLRKMEAAQLRWVDIDFANQVITVRAELTKNRHSYCLPVGPYLLTLLRERRRICAGSPWLFPGRGDNHLVDSGHVIEGAIARSGFYWTMHSLRATFITAARKVGIADYQIKALVNHRRRADVTEGYVVLSAEDVRPAMLRIEAYFVEQFVAGARDKMSQHGKRSNLESRVSKAP